MRASMAKWASALLLLAIAASATAQSPNSVLVVANGNSDQSVALAEHYMSARGIPEQNLLLLDWLEDENADTCTKNVFTQKIAAPIYARIAELAPQAIDYIVICRNLPVKIRENSASVDSCLAAGSLTRKRNPYYGQTRSFSSRAYGMYLVTRLDGWSWDDAFELVDRSLQARPGAPLFFDCDAAKDNQITYRWFNDSMRLAAQRTSRSGLPSLVDNTPTFVKPSRALGGYVSWGSNDSRYNPQAFNSLQFAPGAIAETAVSTSASNLRYPGGRQSQIAVLIRNGVTGVKGYVAEPYLAATADPYRLWGRYSTGGNLAEAFYSASASIGWRDVIVGDPLCAPYRRAAAVPIAR